VNRGRFVAFVVVASVILASTALAQTPATSRFATTYQKWISEDVVYIATPEERAQFLGLTNDQDRLSFIVQFWEKRNPNPGKTENTYKKEEHYRRLAYSNEHFADDRLPGWKTDRGRVYIVYGPPDEKKYVAPPPHRAEIWYYNSGKQFRFVDECDCGQYQVQGLQ